MDTSTEVELVYGVLIACEKFYISYEIELGHAKYVGFSSNMQAAYIVSL